MERKKKSITRRDFLKLGGAAAAAAPVSSLLTSQVIEDREELAALRERYVRKADDPFEVQEGYKPIHQKDIIFTAAFMGTNPGTEEMQKGMFTRFYNDVEVDENRPGFTRLDYAVRNAGFSLYHDMSPGGGAGIGNTGMFAWEQPTAEHRHGPLDYDYLREGDPYPFKSSKEAAIAIKNAAKILGADIVGITKRDPRWDYAGFVDPTEQKMYGWEEFPFEPKTVIVMGFEMDYDLYTMSPTYLNDAATGDGYSKMAKTAYQMGKFLRILGYPAVVSGNDTGLNIPYAIAAGLGEKSRMGMVVSPEFGPRFRISKVYTNLELVDYDSPIEFGVEDFCKHCRKCADACPAGAISVEPEPTFEASYPHGHTWFNNPGTRKWYHDGYSCFQYWLEIAGGCGACIGACPYNKPDFWHHNLVEKITAASPGFVHSLMRQLDDSFGYGNTGVDDPKVQEAAAKFWQEER